MYKNVLRSVNTPEVSKHAYTIYLPIVYSPSGITYGSYGVDSSLTTEPSSFSALSEFKSGLMLTFSGFIDRFLRGLRFFPGWNGGVVRGSLYSLAIANGTMAVLGVVADRSDVTELLLCSRLSVTSCSVDVA